MGKIDKTNFHITDGTGYIIIAKEEWNKLVDFLKENAVECEKKQKGAGEPPPS